MRTTSGKALLLAALLGLGPQAGAGADDFWEGSGGGQRLKPAWFLGWWRRGGSNPRPPACEAVPEHVPPQPADVRYRPGKVSCLGSRRRKLVPEYPPPLTEGRGFGYNLATVQARTSEGEGSCHQRGLQCPQ